MQLLIFFRKKGNAKIMNKRQFHVYSLLYWIYTLVWSIIGIYTIYYSDIWFGVKIVIAFILLLTTPDLSIFAQSYSSYRKKLFGFRSTEDQKIKYVKEEDYNGRSFTGVEVSKDEIITTFRDLKNYCLIEMHAVDKVVVIKDYYNIIFHRCIGNEWEELIEYFKENS